jgi:cobalt/nickel transport system permease protein
MRFDASHLCGAARPSRLDVFDPRCRVICALFLSAALASVQSFPGLLAGSLVPLALLFEARYDFTTTTGPSGLHGLLGTLAHVNAFSVFAFIFLPFTFTGPGPLPGLRMALLITCKLNLISVVLIRMVAALGVVRVDNVLSGLRLPIKMRVLLLLTARYVLLLLERVGTMTSAIRLRAPLLRGRRMCAAFACMLGTTLIHSSDRAERAMLAMRCRAGGDTLAGFSQGYPLTWRWRDTGLCALFAANIAAIAAVCFFV